MRGSDIVANDTARVTVRRQWAPWRTPWIWRKISSRSKAHRDPATGGLTTFHYQGPPEEVGSFVAGAVNQLLGGSPLNAGESDHPGAFLAGQVADAVLSDAAGAVLPSGGGGGGGGGGSFFDDFDEAALFILAVVVVAVVLIVAIPLGILAVELVVALLAVLLGIALRMAHVRPWTILVRRNKVTVAAFSVTGWRSSRRMLHGLKAARPAIASRS